MDKPTSRGRDLEATPGSESTRNEETTTRKPLEHDANSQSARSEATPRQGSRKPQQKSAPDSKLPAEHPELSKETSRPTTSVFKEHPFPVPKHPSKCPLFCCFYAEFDNKVGPKVSYQTPRNFMDQEIQIPLEKIHDILEETFSRLQQSPPNVTSPIDAPQITQPQQSSSTSVPSSSNEASTTINNGLNSLDEDREADEPVNIPDSSFSIFDSCGEYIITGSELTGKIVNLSTHHIHILTRPTVIHDKRYERNALLFCVGFVLRRTEDPRPFRPVLSKLADILRDMEAESQFLSAGSPLLQSILDWILVSLNSATWECNLCLNAANILNLKLFHPPKPPALPVADYAVPVFLRRDLPQSYDWDLAINWVSLHIDGVTNARQISKKAEVDMEMVQACLRVLRHHGVIELVDMFFFSNHYECTEKAAFLLTGKESKLLHDAVEFCMRRPTTVASGSEMSPTFQTSGSPNRIMLEPLADFAGSLRLASVSTQFSHDVHIQPAQRRLEYHDVKTALAELYNACHGGTSIGELWIDLVSADLPPGMPAYINWKKMFSLIDHRRFTSFGLVHGLLRRVHDYPLITDHTSLTNEPQGETLATGRSLERVRPLSRVEASREDSQLLRKRVASCMDGRHCDDELVCSFERSYEELLGLFQGTKIIHVFAAESPV